MKMGQCASHLHTTIILTNPFSLSTTWKDRDKWKIVRVSPRVAVIIKGPILYGRVPSYVSGEKLPFCFRRQDYSLHRPISRITMYQRYQLAKKMRTQNLEHKDYLSYLASPYFVPLKATYQFSPTWSDDLLRNASVFVLRNDVSNKYLRPRIRYPRIW